MEQGLSVKMELGSALCEHLQRIGSECLQISASARALDGDELLADAAAAGIVGHRNGSGDVVLVDLVERGGLGELARLAIGGRCGRSAMRAGGEAAVDAVAVGRVGDDEGARLGLGRRSAENGAKDGA